MSRKWGDPELDRSQSALDQFHSALEVYDKERGGTATASEKQALWQAIMQKAVDTLRASYRPERITTLFVGESPPINGTFFYDGHNHLMVRYMREAIDSALPGEGDFLDGFRAHGWFLDDLVLTPVNHLDDRQHIAAHLEARDSLTQRIAQYRPRAIVILLKKVERIVRDAAAAAGSTAPIFAVPFPGNGQQRKFLADMRDVVSVLPKCETAR
jgi:hypothetical protein